VLHVLITDLVFSSSSVLLWLLLLLQGSQPRTHRVEGKLWWFLAYTCEHSWDSGMSLSEWSRQKCQLRSHQCKAVIEPWGWAPWETMERKEGWWLHLRKPGGVTFMRKVIGRRKKIRNVTIQKAEKRRFGKRQSWKQGNRDQHLSDRILMKLPLNIIKEPILNAWNQVSNKYGRAYDLI